MKDPSSPLDVCPFCGKAFKRLKSHLPHCKMAETNNLTPQTDSGGKSKTANLVPRKSTDTVVQSQEPKVKAKSKTEGLQSQVRQTKTPRGKAGKVTSESKSTQLEAAGTIERSQKAPQTRTKKTAKSAKERAQDQVALTETNAPVQQSLMLRPSPQTTLPATVQSPTISNPLETVKGQDFAENCEGNQAIRSAPKWISEQDTVGNSVAVQDHFQDLSNEQIHLGQTALPGTFSGSTNAFMVFGWSTGFPQERFKTQIPGISPIVCKIEAEMPIKALVTIKSMETKIDVLSPSKTPQIEQPQPVGGPLGLQWVPQLYSNYVQLGIVPGRQDQWDLNGRGTKRLEPIGGLPEHCKSVCQESILENQSTSKHMMEVRSKPLMEVRLGQLPAWLATRSYSPKRIPELVGNAWGRYYNKYINVKKGGVGGVTMLLAGYCILSYLWSYDHISKIYEGLHISSTLPIP